MNIMPMINQKNRRTRVVSSTRQRVDIYNLLKEHLRLRDNGLWSYEPGFDDWVIARKVDPSGRLTNVNVSLVRKKEFGNLVRAEKQDAGGKEQKLTLEDLNKKLNLVLERLAEIDRIVKKFE